ncbi:MAG: putative metallopeptidase [Nanoarchaeota archaeon]
MRYEDAPDLKKRMEEVVSILSLNHINISRVECLRSRGSSSRRTIARCHTLGKLMQKAMKTNAFYAIEFLERFDKMSQDEQDKVIIHELMHIPKTFGGGFRQHDFVCDKNVEIFYRRFKVIKNNSPEKEKRTPSVFCGENQNEFSEEKLEESQKEKQSNAFKFPFWR